MVTMIKIRDRYCDPRFEVFLLDSDDTSGLPTSKQGNGEFSRCAVGSIAFTADESIRYRLGNDNVWHKIRGGSSDGSGDVSPSADDINSIPDSDISTLFPTRG